MDILKIRGKKRSTSAQEQDDLARIQNAYQKIIFKRMPILPRLLQDFGVKQNDFHELSFAKIRLYILIRQLQAKKLNIEITDLYFKI